MYPFALLNDPPKPTYPQYDDLLAEARRIAPRFVDPANAYPERPIVDRRGDDWCTAVLGRPFDITNRITVTEQYLLIAADRADIDPPLPDWIVEGRAESERRRAELEQRKQEQRDREAKAWADALAQTTATFEVHAGSRARARGNVSEPLRHAVPTADVQSGTRKPRIHPAGRAVCETPGRSNPLQLAYQVDAPATCVRCLAWIPQVRPATKTEES
jgi:hypothetical protein